MPQSRCTHFLCSTRSLHARVSWQSTCEDLNGASLRLSTFVEEEDCAMDNALLLPDGTENGQQEVVHTNCMSGIWRWRQVS